MEKKLKVWRIPVSIIIVAGILLFLCSIYVQHLMNAEKQLLNTYMEEVLGKASLAFEERVQGYVDTMNGIAASISPEKESEEETLEVLSAQLKNSLLSRYGIIYADGYGYGVDRALGKVEGAFLEREFYSKSMRGETYISEPMPDRFSDETIVVISVPIYKKDGTVGAVLCGIQTVEELQKKVELPALGGEGYFYIINSDGNLLFRSEDADLKLKEDNLFRGSYKKVYSWKEMQENLKKQESGAAGFTKMDGEQKYVIYESMDINDWYMTMIAPASILTEKEKEVMLSSLLLLGGASAVIILLMSNFMLYRKKSKKQMNYLAYYDELTGIYNKNMFLKKMLELSELYSGTYMLAVLDICNFKAFNKLFGFQEGDNLIQNVGRALYRHVRDGELFCRESSDHFWILFREDNKEVLEQRISAVFDEICHTQIRDSSVQYSFICRCGVYQIQKEDEGRDLHTLFDFAFVARNTMLDIHKNRIAFYDDRMDKLLEQKNEIEQNMYRSLKQEEFLVYLQPKYAIQDGERLYGAEALTRWNFRGERMIFPDQFIPIFEKNGFITELDMYMLEHVCRLQRKWLDEGKHCVPVSVNQSRVNMYRMDFVEEIVSIVDRYQVPHELIDFEITESAIVDDEKLVRAQFWKLKQLGFLISIDDFGSGYSSLNLLKDLNADIVKIDKGFFNESFPSKKGRQIVESIVKMLQELGIKVVAEGIETEEQAAFLKTSGCDYIQGYYFGKPVCVDEFVEMHFDRQNQ